GRPVLQEIAGSPRADHLQDVLLVVVHRQDEDAGRRKRLVDPARRLDPGEARHADVEDDDVRLRLQRLLHGLADVGSLRDDFDVRARLQDPDQTLAHDRVIVGDEDPDLRHARPSPAPSGISPSTTVAPGEDRTRNVPLKDWTRSRIARTPKPRSSSFPERTASASKPTPRSSTATKRRSPRRSTRTRAEATPACRTTFVSASWTMRKTSVSASLS